MRTPPPKAIPFILQALRILAALDPDRASLRNRVGFSAADSSRGRALAATCYLDDAEAVEALILVERYHRQLPADLLRAARWTPPRVKTSLADAFDAILAMRSTRAA